MPTTARVGIVIVQMKWSKGNNFTLINQQYGCYKQDLRGNLINFTYLCNITLYVTCTIFEKYYY